MKMKQLICIIAGMLTLGLNVNAQDKSAAPDPGLKIEAATARLQGTDLTINWSSNAAGLDGYWQVQASPNGKDFNTIGMVWGSDPKATPGNFKFKQAESKLKPGMHFYRVVYIQSADMAIAGKVIALQNN